MSEALFRLSPLRRDCEELINHITSRVAFVWLAMILIALGQLPSALAQTPLRPPTPVQSPLSAPQAATNAPATSTSATLKPPQPAAASPATSTSKTAATPATTVQVAPGSTIKFAPGLMTLSQLRALPANTMIELRNGQKVKASQFTATADALKDLGTKKATLKRMDFVFTRPTAVAQLKLNAGNLAAARAMAPNTVLELPNGIKLTSAELKKLDALEARTNIRQLLGGNAPSAAGANRYAGQPAIQLKTKADIEKLKGKPDSTIIEAPGGARSTLGELKAALAEKYKR